MNLLSKKCEVSELCSCAEQATAVWVDGLFMWHLLYKTFVKACMLTSCFLKCVYERCIYFYQGYNLGFVTSNVNAKSHLYNAADSTAGKLEQTVK